MVVNKFEEELVVWVKVVEVEKGKVEKVEVVIIVKMVVEVECKK